MGLAEKAKISRNKHFDAPLSRDEADSIVSGKVESHAFLPFISYDRAWVKFSPSGTKGTRKKRTISYASRRDSYLYGYYRSFLADRYEKALEERGLQDSVLAYRRIPVVPQSRRNKCNIHFALDSFEDILGWEFSTVYCLDIQDFFGTLDHCHLKAQWANLISFTDLPDDHFAIYRAITQAASVDRKMVYRKLGFYGEKTVNGRQKSGFLKPYKDIPEQLCSPQEFKLKISPLIQTNKSGKGIPQGSPISDGLANLYLLDFDCAMKKWIDSLGGTYRRYSDDILLILPGTIPHNVDPEQICSEMLREQAHGLVLKAAKTSILRFVRGADQKVVCTNLRNGNTTKGFEYLGFRFDGENVYVRDSTLSGLHRRVTFSIKRWVWAHIAANPGDSEASLKRTFNFSGLISRYAKVKSPEHGELRKTTFLSYARRSQEIFGEKGLPILRQVRSFKRIARHKVDDEIRRQLGKRKAAAGATVSSLKTNNP